MPARTPSPILLNSLCLILCLATARAETNTPTPPPAFTNGTYTDFVVRPDADGHHIAAHHGGILFVNGKYWWYGQTFQDKSTSQGGQTTMIGVVMYSSPDLLTWKHEGVILPCQPTGDLAGPLRFERPKILYNDKTRKFVLWCHYVGRPGDHGVKPGTADAGVASCATINGTYQWHGYHRPLGANMTVKDCTLFKDDDGAAYFIFDSYPMDRSKSRCLHIARLSDDYLKTVEVRRIPGAEHREAPAMIKNNGYYFLITSGVSSWEPNAAKCHRATNIWGPYQDLGNFCVGEHNDITFNAQSTYIFERHDAPGSYIFMGDRWCQPDMARSAHIWLPLEFPTSDTVRMRYFPHWTPRLFHSDVPPK
jgi:beta-galactosidase